MTRCIRSIAAAMLLVAFLATVASYLPAALPSGAAAEDEAIRRARDRGVEWLVSAQQPDGSWGSGGFRGSVAVTANAALTLVAAGSTPSSGPHADAVARAVGFLLDAADDEGLFVSREPGSRGPMYGQAYATLLLAELLGEVDAPTLPETLRRSARLFEATQNEEGGWRYQPRRGDADASVTASVVVALAALDRTGIEVSEACMGWAIEYLQSLQNGDGGFRYQASAGESAAPRTAAAVVALVAAGANTSRDGREGIERAVRWLERNAVGLEPRDAYALYGVAASANAFWQFGGEPWRAYFGPAARQLVESQEADGSWSDPSCREYGTAAAVAALSVPDGLVPVFQP